VRVGLSLWNSLPATFAVEGLMFALAVALYMRLTRASDRTGTIAWWVLIGVLVLLYVTAPLSPPPPGENAVAIAGLIALAIFVSWAYWVDQHRQVTG
jgi:drug/metabolite transporter (DMT)-like permease